MHRSHSRTVSLDRLTRDVRHLEAAIGQAIAVVEEERVLAAGRTRSTRARLIAIMGLGVFLNDIQLCRKQAQALTARLPALNSLEPTQQRQTLSLFNQLFGIVQRATEIEQQTWELAAGNLRKA